MHIKTTKCENPGQLRNELDLVHKLLQPALRPRLEELITKGTTTGPLIVEFDPTTTCNFSCPECISMGLLNKGQFDPDRVLSIIDEFYRAGVKGIVFIGGGEPLAHSSMPEPIVHAHRLGMAVGLTTNGSLVDRYIDEIAECVKWTRFSVDAGTAETFAVFRPSYIKNSFAKVISNIERLVKIKKGKVGYSFLLLERKTKERDLTNYDEIYQAARLARDIGCDYFEVKPAVDENHHLVPLTADTRKKLLEQLALLSDLETKYFRVISPNSLWHLLMSASTNQPKSYHFCPTLELRTVVTPKGIYPCPYKRGYEQTLLGMTNVKFNEYWVSKERIQRARKIDPSVDCSFHCIRHEMNMFLIEQMETQDSEQTQLNGLTQVEVDDDLFI